MFMPGFSGDSMLHYNITIQCIYYALLYSNIQRLRKHK